MANNGDSVKVILNLDVTLIEMVVIPLLLTFNIVVWDQLCCCVSEFAMLTEFVKLNLMYLHYLERWK